MCTAAYPGCTYSASTAEIPSGCRVILGLTDFEFMDVSVSGNIATSDPSSTWRLMTKSNRSATFTAFAAGVLVVAGLPTQAQQTAPVRQERGNLIFESVPPRDTQLAE